MCRYNKAVLTAEVRKSVSNALFVFVKFAFLNLANFCHFSAFDRVLIIPLVSLTSLTSWLCWLLLALVIKKLTFNSLEIV